MAGGRGAGFLALAAISIITIALSALPSPASASPGWDLILDRPKPDFQGIDFPTPDEGWLVAGAGLLRTGDGGATWTEAATLSGIDVDFADADHGWLVGYNGMIWATADGGETWQVQNSGTSVHLSDVVALSAQEAWVVGYGTGFSDAITLPIASVLLHTTDGGVSWQPVELPPGAWFRQLAIVGQQGWLLGEACIIPPDASYCAGEFASVILHSADGGDTWASLAADLPRNVVDIAFVDDERNGWLIGELCDDDGCRQSPYKTSDGGQTWLQVSAGTGVSTEHIFAHIEAQDANTVWAVSTRYDRQNSVLEVRRTVDGGESWTLVAELPLGFTQYARTFSLQHGRLSIAGSGGLLRHSADGGMTWREAAHPALELADVDFVDAKVGFSASADSLVRSDDGGESWERVGPAPGYTRILAFIDASTGFAATNSCGTACGPDIERTTDGGRTWTTVHHTTEAFGFQRSIEFVDRQHGWVVTDRAVIVTGDGGATWQERPLPSETGDLILEADLAGPDDAWAFVQGTAPEYVRRIVHSQDGGRTWQAVRSPAEPAYPAPIVFVDADHGWYADTVCEATCRVVINATADGGATWSAYEFGRGYVRDMLFVDGVNGWINGSGCSDSGCSPDEILHTADAGRTWTVQLSHNLLLGQFEFVDVRHGWFASDPSRGLGLGGGLPQRTLLYRTTDGGGGPIGVEPTPPPKFPDVGTGPASTRSSGLTPIALLLGAGAVALGAGTFVARRRWR